MTLLVIVAGVAGGCGTQEKAPGPPQLTPSSAQLSAAVVQFPMRPVGPGLPVVTATVGSGAGSPATPGSGSGGTATMVLDTGSAFVMFSQEMVSRTGLPTRSARLIGADASGSTRRASGVANVKRMCLSGGPPGAAGPDSACFGGFDAFVTELPKLPGGAINRVDGVLGLPLFRDVTLTIDFPRSVVRIERGALPPPDGRDVLPLQLAAGGRLLVPLRLGGREVWTQLDTGFTSGLLIPDWAVAAFPGAEQARAGGEKFNFMHGGSARARTARLREDLSIGQHLIRRPVVSVGLGQDPTIGTDYLRHFAVTIDQKNKRVRFTRVGRGPIEVSPVLRAGFEADPATGLVRSVTPDSGAARAGVRVGDRLVRVEGVPFNKYADLGGAPSLAQPNHVAIELARDGGTVRLNVPLTVVVP